MLPDEFVLLMKRLSEIPPFPPHVPKYKKSTEPKKNQWYKFLFMSCLISIKQEIISYTESKFLHKSNHGMIC